MAAERHQTLRKPISGRTEAKTERKGSRVRGEESGAEGNVRTNPNSLERTLNQNRVIGFNGAKSL